MILLHVIHSLNPEHGGLAEGLLQLVRADAGPDVAHEVLTLDPAAASWLSGFPAPVYALGPARGSYGYTPRLVPWLRKHAPAFDAVVVHGLWQYHGLATSHALRGTGLPYFVFPHGMLDPWFKHEYPLKHLKKWLYWPWAEYRVLRDAKAVLFTAQEEARLAPQSFALYRARPAVVGFGLTLDEIALDARAEEFLDRYPASHNKRLLLFLARLHPKKGCDLLIEAFARVAATNPSLHLVMAGPDQVGWQPALQALAARLGVADRITWCGMLEGRMKWAAVRAAEVFVLPSHQENFGVAVAEAMALGVPVLISDKVNIWREIAADEAGFVAPDTREGTIALLQRWLALDPGKRRAMQVRAAACYRSHFHMDSAARRLVETIRGAEAPQSRAMGGPLAPIHGVET